MEPYSALKRNELWAIERRGESLNVDDGAAETCLQKVTHCDPKRTTSWKRQTQKTAKRWVAARDWGQGTKWMSADFQGSRTAPCDTTVGTRANPQGAQHQSEPWCKLWTLGDNDVNVDPTWVKNKHRTPSAGCWGTLVMGEVVHECYAFALWRWRRLLRLLWTARRANQSILKEINPEYSLEGLKLKFQSFGHLMWRADSSEKTLMLGKMKVGGEGDDRGWDGWMASPTQWTWIWASSGRQWRTEEPGVMQSMG